MGIMKQQEEVEKIAKTVTPKLREIDPNLSVSVERRRIEPIEGESYMAWVLFFKCQDLHFSMEPTASIDSIRKAFLNASSNKKAKVIRSIQEYNNSRPNSDKVICEVLKKIIDQNLSGAESKIWHAHPVWFLEGNPIVGYSKLKNGNRYCFKGV